MSIYLCPDISTDILFGANILALPGANPDPVTTSLIISPSGTDSNYIISGQNSGVLLSDGSTDLIAFSDPAAPATITSPNITGYAQTLGAHNTIQSLNVSSVATSNFTATPGTTLDYSIYTAPQGSGIFTLLPNSTLSVPINSPVAIGNIITGTLILQTPVTLPVGTQVIPLARFSDPGSVSLPARLVTTGAIILV